LAGADQSRHRAAHVGVPVHAADVDRGRIVAADRDRHVHGEHDPLDVDDRDPTSRRPGAACQRATLRRVGRHPTCAADADAVGRREADTARGEGVLMAAILWDGTPVTWDGQPLTWESEPVPEITATLPVEISLDGTLAAPTASIPEVSAALDVAVDLAGAAEAPAATIPEITSSLAIDVDLAGAAAA